MSVDARKARILEAALAEFAAAGYEAASTNAIAEAAGVAKGLVFHHFGNKQALFAAVAEHVVERTVARFFTDGPQPPPTELFERLYRWSLLKLEIFQEDPDGFRFLTRSIPQAPPEVRAPVERLYGALVARHWPTFLAGVDTSRLRPGLTLADAVETITLLAEGLERRLTPLLLESPSAHPSLTEAMWKHFERLRDGLYRP